VGKEREHCQFQVLLGEAELREAPSEETKEPVFLVQLTQDVVLSEWRRVREETPSEE
jgi:hypothetical protein